MATKRVPKRDSSGKGAWVNQGRGGCAAARKTGGDRVRR